MKEIELHWLSKPGFAMRYAIRMPNGELYAKPQPVKATPSTDSLSGLWGSVFGIGFLSSEPLTPPTPAPPKPEIFEDRSKAEALLQELRDTAARFGVTEWGGMIVAQLCTPFTSGDPTMEFAEQVIAWIAEQGGGVK